MFFFFQAEDGIRDAQESRGLGDVYKRQPELAGLEVPSLAELLAPSIRHSIPASLLTQLPGPVSYTHLTLPTTYSV